MRNIILFLFIFSYLAVSAQQPTKADFYKAYINGDMKAWARNIDVFEKNLKFCFLRLVLVFCLFDLWLYIKFIYGRLDVLIHIPSIFTKVSAVLVLIVVIAVPPGSCIL